MVGPLLAMDGEFERALQKQMNYGRLRGITYVIINKPTDNTELQNQTHENY